jgi:surface protein
MPKSSQKKGGAKKEYTGTYRHFTLHEVNDKEVEIGTATIKDHQTPLNAAKKLLSSWCRHEGIKSNERNKVNITFTIRETTRGHSKIYGPYKGKFVKYDKPVMIKLKNGKVIKRTVKPMVKLSKGNNNKKMMGGESNNDNNVRDKAHLKELMKDPNRNLSELNVSKVTDMSGLFKQFPFSGRKGNSDISGWNVSKVEDMSEMFNVSTYFNQDLNNWDVSNVKNMKGMFRYCEDFNKDLSNWNVSKVEDMSEMFYRCKKFRNGGKSLTWTLKNEEVNMDSIFSYTPLFNVTYCANSQINPSKYPPNWKKYVEKLKTDIIKLKTGNKIFIQVNAHAHNMDSKQITNWVTNPEEILAEYTFNYFFVDTCYPYTGPIY